MWKAAAAVYHSSVIIVDESESESESEPESPPGTINDQYNLQLGMIVDEILIPPEYNLKWSAPFHFQYAQVEVFVAFYHHTRVVWPSSRECLPSLVH